MKLRLTTAIVFIVSLFAFSSCSKVMHDKTGEEEEREIVLKNKIKSIAEYKIPVFAGLEQKEQLLKIRMFDVNGFKTKEINYKTEGGIDRIMTFEYDKNGNLILTKGVNQDSSLLFKETRSYDEKGNRKELFFYFPDGTYEYKNIATYDDAGRMTELAWYWPIGFRSKNVYKYEGRRKTEDTEYDAHAKFKYKWTYNYDTDGNLIEALQYYPGDVINSKITYGFNADKQLIRKTNYFGESIQSILTFEYDSKNLLTAKTESSPSGKTTARFRYNYEFF